MEENLSGIEKKKGLSIFNKKEIWISGIIGLLIGSILIYVLGMLGFIGLNRDNTLATFKGGKVKESDLTEELKKEYGFTYTLQLADEGILDNLYELTDEQKEEIDETLDYLLSYYGYTEESFKEEYDLNSREEIAEYTGMFLEYKTNLACLDYFKTLISEEDIQNYYNENDVYGKINTKHILVQLSDDATEKESKEALKKANEIVAELKKGNNFDDVASKYADGETIISQDVDFTWIDEENFAEEYVTASKSLEKDAYTSEPVLTDFGYHIIYCVDKAKKPSLEESKDGIIEKLGADLEAEDELIRYKALIKLREDNGLEFKDNKIKEEYEKYCEEIEQEEQE